MRFLIFLGLLCCCLEGYAKLPNCTARIGAQDPERKNCLREWSILLYMAGDNDLNSFAAQDLLEIREHFRTHQQSETFAHLIFDLLVEVDGAKTDGSLRIAFSQDGHKKLLRLPEQNTGDPKTLENFLSWSMENYPAQHYMLIIWGHGDGWAAMDAISSDANNLHTKDQSKGIAYDEHAQDWLNTKDLAQVLATISKKYLGGKPIDLFAADACLMQQAEVAFELSPYARYIMGSLPLMDQQGIPYTKLFNAFAEEQFSFTNWDYLDGDISWAESDGAYLLAKKLPKMITEHYTGQNDRLMLSSLSGAAMQKLHAALENLGKKAINWLDTQDFFASTKIMLLAKNSLQYKSATVDFYEFLVRWNTNLQENALLLTPIESALQEAIHELQELVLQAAIEWSFGSEMQEKAQFARGLSIWIPSDFSEFQAAKIQFQQSRLLQKKDSTELNHWGQFLHRLFAP